MPLVVRWAPLTGLSPEDGCSSCGDELSFGEFTGSSETDLKVTWFCANEDCHDPDQIELSTNMIDVAVDLENSAEPRQAITRSEDMQIEKRRGPDLSSFDLTDATEH